MHACALTYLSDIGTGLSVLESDEAAPGPSLDHALWFHRPVRLDDWVLMDLTPRTVAAGRGWYTGAVTTRDGLLAASVVQESLFRLGAMRRAHGAAPLVDSARLSVTGW